MNEFTEEKLQELVELVRNYRPSTPYVIMPKWWVEEEMAAHPERFGISNDEDRTMTWCGYTVYTYGDRYE